MSDRCSQLWSRAIMETSKGQSLCGEWCGISPCSSVSLNFTSRSLFPRAHLILPPLPVFLRCFWLLLSVTLSLPPCLQIFWVHCSDADLGHWCFYGAKFYVLAGNNLLSQHCRPLALFCLRQPRLDNTICLPVSVGPRSPKYLTNCDR